MKEKEKYILLKTVQDNSILPVTSVCNMACKFCSHRQNPAGVEVYSFGHLSLELIEELIDYLPAEGPVILGESATKIIEGDPLIHPDILQILKCIREKWSEKEIRITTNGSSLSEKMVRLLHKIEPVSLNISLNCASPEDRVFLMSDSAPEEVFKGLERLHKYNINFNGSLVAMPQLLGWDSIEKTLDVFARYKPQTVRVFLPGFTRYAPENLKFPLELRTKLSEVVTKLNEKHKFPVIMEPPILENFEVKVKGIISESPAARTDIKIGDTINKINGVVPETRVEAFNRLTDSESPQVDIIRNQSKLKVIIKKEQNEKTGVVFDYDLSPEVITGIRNILERTTAKNILIITSEFANLMIKKFITRLSRNFDDKNLKLLPVENKYFGGSIQAVGLLTNQDIIAGIKSINYKELDLIIIPGIIYDIFGNDLTGSNYQLIIDKFNIKLEIID